MRYHAGIAAALAGRPVVLLGYSAKVGGLGADLDARTLPWDLPHPDELAAAVVDALARPPELLEERLAELQRREAGQPPGARAGAQPLTPASSATTSAIRTDGLHVGPGRRRAAPPLRVGQEGVDGGRVVAARARRWRRCRRGARCAPATRASARRGGRTPPGSSPPSVTTSGAAASSDTNVLVGEQLAALDPGGVEAGPRARLGQRPRRSGRARRSAPATGRRSARRGRRSPPRPPGAGGSRPGASSRPPAPSPAPAPRLEVGDGVGRRVGADLDDLGAPPQAHRAQVRGRLGARARTARGARRITTRRMISSGNGCSSDLERRPASRWATRRPARRAMSVDSRVDGVSPCTRQSAGVGAEDVPAQAAPRHEQGRQPRRPPHARRRSW